MLEDSIRRFNSTVNFVGNNQIIPHPAFRNFSTHVTMNEISTNNGLIKKLVTNLETKETES